MQANPIQNKKYDQDPYCITITMVAPKIIFFMAIHFVIFIKNRPDNLYVKSNMENVSILNYIVLSFNIKLAGFFACMF